MTDESVERLITFLATSAKTEHQNAKKQKIFSKAGRYLKGFHRGSSSAYLIAAKITRAYQKHDKKGGNLCLTKKP